MWLFNDNPIKPEVMLFCINVNQDNLKIKLLFSSGRGQRRRRNRDVILFLDTEPNYYTTAAVSINDCR